MTNVRQTHQTRVGDGKILQQMLYTIIVLIPKRNSGDFWGMRLLEVLWKVIERVLDERISAIPLHDTLHSFQAKRVCGTGIIKAKLAQKLAYLKRVPTYSIFLDLHKAYAVWTATTQLRFFERPGLKSR